MINVVTDFGAVPDNFTSNYWSLQYAFNAAQVNGDEIYFPPGVYKIKGNASGAIPPVILDTRPQPHIYLDLNIKLFGKGAKIYCDTNTAGPAGLGGSTPGKGGGFGLYGNNVTVEDLEFEAPIYAFGDLNDSNGCLLALGGENNIVRNCKFKGGNGSAIGISGRYVHIDGNFLDQCNYHPDPGGHYGSIHLHDFSQYITIINNHIVEQHYSGICAFNTLKDSTTVSHLQIIGNYIRSDSSTRVPAVSMGIYLLDGANQHVLISNNIIEKMDAEGIEINSKADLPGRDCIISGNIIRDCNYRGIALENTDGFGSWENYTIADNLITHSAAADSTDHLIWLARFANGIITNNRCIGLSRNPLFGIVFSNTSTATIVTNNSVSGCKTGIHFGSKYGILAKNIVSDCDEGILVSGCNSANIHENLIKSCGYGFDTPIDNGNSAIFPKQLWSNAVLDCAERFKPSTSILPEVLPYTGVATDTALSNYIVKDTLVAGVKTITFYHIYPEDRFLVIPINTSSDVAGVLYVSSVNAAASTMIIRSTLATDARSFMVVKMFAGG